MPSTFSTPLILLQNGWSMNDHYFSHTNSLIFNSYIPYGITRPKPNETHINSSAGPVMIGHIYEETPWKTIEEICQASTAGGIDTQFSIKIVPFMWTKMLYNCTVNTLTYILSIKNGVLLESNYCREMIGNIVFEMFEVAHKEKISLAWTNEKQFIEKLYTLFIPITKDHTSSMLQDRLSFQKTEIEFLNEAIVKLGEKHQLSCQTNRIVVDLVRVIETNQLSK
jgi:2-dehydropantoate 2-reductase